MAAVSCGALNNSLQLHVARRLLSAGPAMLSVDRELESLFRSQVRDLERTTVREAEESNAAIPLRKLPKFRRSLVESRRAMRSRGATSSISTALIAAIPMTVLTAGPRVCVSQ